MITRWMQNEAQMYKNWQLVVQNQKKNQNTQKMR